MLATGKGEKSISVKIMRWLELFVCKKAAKVVVVTKGFKKTLISEGIVGHKIEVITNGVDIKKSERLHTPGKTLVLSYFGTLGISQNILDTFEYSKVILDIIGDFKYLIIGEGAQKKEIEYYIEQRVGSFVHILPGMSSDKLEAYYNYTQMSVITLRKSDNFKYTIPSKLFHIMGRGIAVLFIGPDGEASEIIRKYHAGIALTDTKENDLQVLKSFFSNSDWKEQLLRMGENGRKATESNYSRAKLAKYYIDVLDTVRT